MKSWQFLLLAALFCPHARAQTVDSKDPIAIVEIGTSVSRSLTESATTVSPTVAVEFTPIEHWLEIEIGVTRSKEWTTDLLFKKPWTLSKKVEFMVGAGPEWIHSRTNSLGGQVALDFMFWPTAKRRFGWYLEPAYEFSRHEKSVGITAGLLISIFCGAGH